MVIPVQMLTTADGAIWVQLSTGHWVSDPCPTWDDVIDFLMLVGA